jgi:3-dehydroquinate dehydratase-1
MPTPFLPKFRSVLRRRPLVVGTLVGTADRDAQLTRAASPAVDILEVRLDSFRELFSPGDDALRWARLFLARARERTKKPLLLTLRAKAEAGPGPVLGTFSDARRLALLEGLLPAAALVDVEARHFTPIRAFTRRAKRRGVSVIHSFHDFNGPSTPARLRRWSAAAGRLGADFFKAAVMPRKPEDVESFLSAGLALPGPTPVLIAMGPLGEVSRFIGYSFGSALTFGHLGTAAAPGQVPVERLGAAVRVLYEPLMKGKQ